MLFKELFSDFVAGTPIKREVWRGYWIYKYGKIEIHNKNGTVIDLLDTEDVLFTISNIVQDDWEYANDSNCDIPVKNGKKNELAKSPINVHFKPSDPFTIHPALWDKIWDSHKITY